MPEVTSVHSNYMQKALHLAAEGRFTVSPNPMVGCVIVKNGNIIGEGYHRQAGTPHAEIHALRACRESPQGATVYVTLEPCCHYNRTPPCTDALIAAQVKKVVIACIDPNPKVAGKGIAQLEAAGIKVEIGVGKAEAMALNQVFFHYIQYKRPFVIAKWAMSFDGKTITHPADSRSISNSSSHQHAHITRQSVDAVLIGAQTAIDDDPLLTVRLTSPLKQPHRVILATQGKIPQHLRMLRNDMPSKTFIVCHQAPDWYKPAQYPNVEIIFAAKDNTGKLDIKEVLHQLGAREITSILVEGGMRVLQSFFTAAMVNQVQVYFAPHIIASLKSKQPLSNVTLQQIHTDYFFQADILEGTHV
jgi:diaminohydroxyphosphoribosylaminopyrimidine deaminase / 5-amino-6-(5-phosphoribosylamino)uracil reductase